MNDADILATVIALLNEHTAITALAGVDVYGAELPKEVVRRMPTRAIVVQPSGGPALTAGSYAKLDSQRFDIVAYAATPFEANELRRAAGRALCNVRRRVVTDGPSNVLIHWIEAAGGFFTARDQDGFWPNSFQSFQVFFASQEF